MTHKNGYFAQLTSTPHIGLFLEFSKRRRETTNIKETYVNVQKNGLWSCELSWKHSLLTSTQAQKQMLY